jgi:hypothetical protein
MGEAVARLRFVAAHASDKNKDVANVGHPGILMSNVGHPGSLGGAGILEAAG